MTDDLLPPNASPQERALALSCARFTDLPIAIDTLWAPESCPIQCLPWLAWSLSVDEWESTWPEAMKRQAISQSVFVHLKKGTVSAVKRVLAMLGVQFTVIEWFEQAAPAHTFELLGWVNDHRTCQQIVFSPTLYATLHKHIQAVKPLRSHYQLRVGAAFVAPLAIQAVLSQRNLVSQLFSAPNRHGLRQGMVMAAVGRCLAVLQVGHVQL